MRILVVEDNEKIRGFLKQNLEAACYSVDVAFDGREGVSLACSNPYHLIILDNLMPKLTGIEACEELRASGVKTPILLLSVQSDTNMKVKALNAGADDYLTKPFSLAELLARAKALLRRPQRIEDDVLSYQDLTVDTNKHSITLDYKEIHLTRKEFMLLTYLMRNQGVVLSRGMIMEHVWDMNADPFSNTIETHIASLRKKIDVPDKESFIKTVPGCGYRFGST